MVLADVVLVARWRGGGRLSSRSALSLAGLAGLAAATEPGAAAEGRGECAGARSWAVIVAWLADVEGRGVVVDFWRAARCASMTSPAPTCPASRR